VSKEEAFGCPKKLVDVVISDAEKLSKWVCELIRERSGKEYDCVWNNYHSVITVLCEYYVSTMSLLHYLKEMKKVQKLHVLEDGTKYFILSPPDLSLVSSLMATMRFCEEELSRAYNISLQTH